WPSSYIRLPRLCCYIRHVGSDRPLPPPPPPIMAGFSASPSSNCRDWTLLVVHSRCTDRNSFSTISCGQRRWKNYLHGRGGLVGVSVGYREGKFYVLYEMGNVLIFGIDGPGAVRTMLVADPFSAVQRPGADERRMVILPERPFSTKELCCRVEILRVVGKSIAVSWMRVEGCERLRLVRVDEKRGGTTTTETEEERNSGGEGTVVLLENEYRNYVIEKEWSEAMKSLFFIGCCLIFAFFVPLFCLYSK
ncbi:hypothetical protein LINPERPRIM_LOCUS26764, partial [Linum perenne]